MKISRPAKWCCALTFFVLVVTLGVNWQPSTAQEKKEDAKTEAPPTAAKAETKEESKTEAATTAAAPAAGETKTEETKAPVLPGYMTQSNPDPSKPLAEDPVGANSGYWTTPAPGPVGDGDPAALTPANLYDRIAHNLFSINMVWVLIAGFLVMFMQAGFALVEAGSLPGEKRRPTPWRMNLMIYPLGCIAFWAYGFAIGWGNWFNGPGPLPAGILRWDLALAILEWARHWRRSGRLPASSRTA